MFHLKQRRSFVRKCVEYAGNMTVLAKHIGVTPVAVKKWVDSGEIPSNRVIQLCQSVDWVVTPYQIRPDLYPYPDDAVPPQLRNSIRFPKKPCKSISLG